MEERSYCGGAVNGDGIETLISQRMRPGMKEADNRMNFFMGDSHPLVGVARFLATRFVLVEEMS